MDFSQKICAAEEFHGHDMRQIPPGTAIIEPGHHYFNVGEREIETGIYLTSAGCVRVNAGQNYPQPGHPADYDFSWSRGRVLTDTALVFICNGEGRFETRTLDYAWQPNEAVLIPPGLWHRYRPKRETGWTEFWLTISGEMVGRLWQQWEGRLAIQPLAIADPAVFGRNFERFLRNTITEECEISAGSNRQALTLVAAALSLLGEFVEQHLGESTAPVSDDIVERARRYIWNHSHRPLGVPQIAAAAGVTRRTLERHFTSAVGRTLRQELESVRVQRARKLLEKTTRPIKEIGYLCGFREPRALIRACHRWIGEGPRAIRLRKGQI
jgi:AraC-like DNA-binding protein